MPFDPSILRQDYGDPLGEARTCRRTAALFDFSFVSRCRVSGAGALEAVQGLVTRKLDGLRPGRIAYALRTDEYGCVRSDVTIWRTGASEYELMSGRREDIRALVANSRDCKAEDLSDATSVFALQGPQSMAVLSAGGGDESLSRLGYFHFTETALAGIGCRIGRLGYTGEAGFEIIVDRRGGEILWRILSGVARPAGFAAANILRIEAGFILLCNELMLPVRPPELRLGAFAGTEDREHAEECRLVTFRAARTGTRPVWRPEGHLARPSAAGQLVATSACTSPLVEGTLGLGFARAADLADPARRLSSADFGDVEVVAHPFFDTSKRRPRQPWNEAVQ